MTAFTTDDGLARLPTRGRPVRVPTGILAVVERPGPRVPLMGMGR